MHPVATPPQQRRVAIVVIGSVLLIAVALLVRGSPTSDDVVLPKASTVQVFRKTGPKVTFACMATVIHRYGVSHRYDLLAAADCVADKCYDRQAIGRQRLDSRTVFLVLPAGAHATAPKFAAGVIELTPDYATLQADIPLDLDAFFDDQKK